MAAAQHRRDRQLGRRQHLRRRGQHQDRARRPCVKDGRLGEDARNAAGRDDRRGRLARPAQQLPADAGAFADGGARAGRDAGPAPSDAVAGSAGPARPHGRVSAERRHPRRTREARRRPDPAGARSAARLCQARFARRAAGILVPDDRYLNSELVRYFPKALRDQPTVRKSRPQAAPRDRRDAARQRHHQPRRPGHRHRRLPTRPAPRHQPSPPPTRSPAIPSI
jgi:hypothetical protein